MKKRMATVVAAVGLSALCVSTVWAAGWGQDERGYWYQNPTGSYARSGFSTIDGVMYAFDAEGYLYIKGRKKNMLISGGINLYPEEIEEVLGSHPAIREAIVSGEKHEVLGEVPVARLVREEGADITAAQLITYCREYLEDYKIPVRMEFVEQIEKTSTGKILRRDISAEKVVTVQPRTLHEQQNP